MTKRYKQWGGGGREGVIVLVYKKIMMFITGDPTTVIKKPFCQRAQGTRTKE